MRSTSQTICCLEQNSISANPASLLVRYYHTIIEAGCTPTPSQERIATDIASAIDAWPAIAAMLINPTNRTDPSIPPHVVIATEIEQNGDFVIRWTHGGHLNQFDFAYFVQMPDRQWDEIARIRDASSLFVDPDHRDAVLDDILSDAIRALHSQILSFLRPMADLKVQDTTGLVVAAYERSLGWIDDFVRVYGIPAVDFMKLVITTPEVVNGRMPSIIAGRLHREAGIHMTPEDVDMAVLRLSRHHPDILREAAEGAVLSSETGEIPTGHNIRPFTSARPVR